MTVQRQHRGKLSYHSGRAAEEQIARIYERRGLRVIARRWRGKAGEIDLVLSDGARIAFVEVKTARDFARAAESLRPGQMRRLISAAEEFLGTQPAGQLTECSFDLGLVDGRGACEILENALMLH